MDPRAQWESSNITRNKSSLSGFYIASVRISTEFITRTFGHQRWSHQQINSALGHNQSFMISIHQTEMPGYSMLEPAFRHSESQEDSASNLSESSMEEENMEDSKFKPQRSRRNSAGIINVSKRIWRRGSEILDSALPFRSHRSSSNPERLLSLCPIKDNAYVSTFITLSRGITCFQRHLEVLLGFITGNTVNQGGNCFMHSAAVLDNWTALRVLWYWC